ncbi:hypothetical protein AMJ49_03855 [Parcubacteria bacterium DG_74_2]|nr:MAG: hypothetical protein AMJ49_03855 [Parcubacteria bacterium DG_74_2]
MKHTFTGIGISQKDNLISATKEAAENAKKELTQDLKKENKKYKNPNLLMFFSIYTHSKEEYEQAQKEIYNIFGKKNNEGNPLSLVGGEVLGFFAKDKYFFDPALIGKMAGLALGIIGKVIKPLKFKGVSVLAIQSDYLNVGIGIGLDADKNPEKAGLDCINMAFENLRYNPSLAYMSMLQRGVKDITKFRPLNGFLLTPGISFKHNLLDQQILDAISLKTKRTLRLIGGGGSGGPGDIKGKGKFLETGLGGFKDGYRFYNGGVYKEVVISIIFGSELEIGYGTGSKAKPFGEGVFITKLKNPYVIEELNKRPAADVVAEIYEKYVGVKNQEFFQNPILPAAISGKGYVFSLPESRGEFFWPIVFLRTIDNKYIQTVCPLQTNLGLEFVKLTKENCIKATTEAAQIMIDDVKSKNFEFVLFFSCGVRGQIMGKEYFKEIEKIKQVLEKKDVPVFGICSVGEQGFYKNGPMTASSILITMLGISEESIFISEEAR